MANIKISQLNALEEQPAADDLFVVVDVSEPLDANKTKKVTFGNMGKWQDWTPTWTAATTNPTIGNGTLSGRYCQIGKLVFAQAYLKFGSTTSPGEGTYRFGFPVAPKIPYADYYMTGSASIMDYGSRRYSGIALYNGATYWSIKHSNGADWISHNSPMTWTTDDFLSASFFYEAA